MNIFSINGQLFQYLLPSWSPYQPHRQPLLLNERGGNCVFEFCNNVLLLLLPFMHFSEDQNYY